MPTGRSQPAQRLRRDPNARVVTLAEVAQRAGASAASASRALNGRSGVRADVRQAVLRAAKQLGYVPNSAARNLAMRRTGLVGLVVSDVNRVMGTSFFPELVASIGTTLDEADLHAVLLLPKDDDKRQRLADYIGGSGHVDGAIVIGHRAKDPLLIALAERRLPTVVLSRPIGLPPLTYVDVDNVGGARSAVRHLLSTGRRRIAMVGGPQDTAWGQDRVEGYRAELAASGIPYDDQLVRFGDFTHDSGWSGMDELLRGCPDLDAVFAASEVLAHGVLARLKQGGKRIPADVAVVTYDDGPSQAFADPPLTVVRQPLSTIGAELGRLIIERLSTQDDVVRHVILGATLEVRASTAGRQ